MVAVSQGWAWNFYDWWGFKSVSKILLGKMVEQSFRWLFFGVLCIDVAHLPSFRIRSRHISHGVLHLCLKASLVSACLWDSIHAHS